MAQTEFDVRGKPHFAEPHQLLHINAWRHPATNSQWRHPAAGKEDK